MEELLKKFVEGTLKKSEYKELFQNPAYQRADIINKLFDEVNTKNGVVDRDAAAVFMVVYQEFNKNKRDNIDPKTLISVFESAHIDFKSEGNSPRRKFLLATPETPAIEFANNGSKHVSEFRDLAKDNYVYFAGANINFSTELYEQRFKALDKTISNIIDCPAETMNKLFPDKKPGAQNLFNYMVDNYSSITVQEKANVSKFLGDDFTKNCGHNMNFEIKANVKDAKDALAESAPKTEPGKIELFFKTIDKSLVESKEFYRLTEKDSNINAVLTLFNATIHDANHHLQYNAGLFSNNESDKKVGEFYYNGIDLALLTKNVYVEAVERDSFIVDAYMGSQLDKRIIKSAPDSNIGKAIEDHSTGGITRTNMYSGKVEMTPELDKDIEKILEKFKIVELGTDYKNKVEAFLNSAKKGLLEK